MQHTVNKEIKFSGIGLHSGKIVNVTVKPANIDSGFIFIRTDLDVAIATIKATYDNVTNTQLGTVISNSHGSYVSTIEHLMAAFWGAGVDNAIIELDGPEMPIMDGSSQDFVHLIGKSNLQQQNMPRKIMIVKNKIRVEQKDAYIEIAPAEMLTIDLEIKFTSKSIGNQHYSYNENMDFADYLGNARTFGFEADGEKLRAIGLTLGASTDNAIIIGHDDNIMNPEGLRTQDEFVRHKTLDCVGDLFLAGCRVKGAVNAYCSGHGLNNQLLRKIFADASNYEIVSDEEFAKNTLLKAAI
jgi:UDP-3-O-[3-hydroxymyristoyl] N-acetylglucosamine deacetylase